MTKHIVIIGGGPGGYVAAIRGAQLGAKVTLIEKDQLGGTCLNRGCIPTKTLYRTAEVTRLFKEASTLGINANSATVDGSALKKRCDNVVLQLRSGIEQLIAGNEIEYIKGTACFEDAKKIKIVTSKEEHVILEPDAVIIATGSKPSYPELPGMDLPGVISSDELLAMDTIPDSMVVLGGGVIGVEFAMIYAALGAKIDLMIRYPVVLRKLDADINKRFSSTLKRKGVNLVGGVTFKGVEQAENGMLRVLADGKTGPVALEAKTVLVALGRSPVVEDLQLEKAGVTYSNKGIVVDDDLQTNKNGIYAIGDVLGGVMLAHWASYQGIKAVEHVMHYARNDGKDEFPIIPDCVFAFPEIATAGLTEEEAKNRYGEGVKTSKFMFGANGKALALGETEGFVKVVAHPEGHLIGVHIMGPSASVLIHEGVVALKSKMKATDFSPIIHAHPTLSEAFHEAVLGLENEAIHMAPSKNKRVEPKVSTLTS